jgi:hypothetical protein
MYSFDLNQRCQNIDLHLEVRGSVNSRAAQKLLEEEASSLKSRSLGFKLMTNTPRAPNLG